MIYLDASALVKRVLSEPESPALERFLAGRRPLVSSAIIAVELMLAARRAARTERVVDQARRSLSTLELREVDDQVIALAQDGPLIRSLDAIHLATALSLAPDLEAFVCYDRRLGAAAREAGLAVEAPGDPHLKFT